MLWMLEVVTVMWCWYSETASHWKAAGHLWSAQRLAMRRLHWTSMATLTRASSPRMVPSSATTAPTKGRDELVRVNTWRRSRGLHNCVHTVELIASNDGIQPLSNARDTCVCMCVCVCHVVMWPKNSAFFCRSVHSDSDVNAICFEGDLSKFIKPVFCFTRTFSLLY